jgi:hypothetical protein
MNGHTAAMSLLLDRGADIEKAGPVSELGKIQVMRWFIEAIDRLIELINANDKETFEFQFQ